DQQAVGVAVVAALELDDLVAAGVAACQANRTHGRFGAGADHAHHVHRRHQLAHLLGHLYLDGGRCTKAQAVGNGVLYGSNDVGIAVTENQWAPGADVVDIAVVVFVKQVRALAAVKKYRLAADTAKSAHRRIDAARDVLLGLLEQFAGCLASHYASGNSVAKRRAVASMSSLANSP